MTTEERILKLTGEGFDIVIGCHTEFSGYHVCVFREDEADACGDCGHDYRLDLWHFVGHGFTVEEALINGELKARGKKPVKDYNPEDFEDNEHRRLP